jgi:hypothetical protein
VDDLTRAAITGTSREAPPATGLPTDDLLGSVEWKSPERDLLLRAGMQAVYMTAGRRTETGVEAPGPAAEETLQACSARAAENVGRLLAGRREEIFREALERLRLAGLRLPYALLPAALDVQQTDLRPAVGAVLGERGRWLAALNPDWRWATLAGEPEENDEVVWEEGTLEERITALRRVRRREADQGRRWVEETWKTEKADARMAMAEVLETDLSSADEPFLERALHDRSVRVREAAAALLARIPGSAYAERAVARADSILVRYEPPAGGLQGMAAGLTGRGRAGKLVVEPPERVDEEWSRDLPGSDRPPQVVGEQAWRVSHALAVVPLEHWEDRFGVEPPALIAAARGDWEAALLKGWCHAVGLHRNRGWAMPLWERCYRTSDDFVGRLTWEAARHLAPVLPQSEFAVALPGLFFGSEVEMSLRLSATLQAIPSPWRPGLSEVYLDRLRQRLRGFEAYGQARGEDPWLLTLSHAASSLALESLAGAIGLKELLGGWAGKGNYVMLQWGRDLDKFEETLELRRKLVEEIPL